MVRAGGGARGGGRRVVAWVGGRCYRARVVDDFERVLAYHERSKHRPGRYAASLGYMDWDSQPNPFRVYAGAETLALPRRVIVDGPGYDALFEDGAVAPAPLSLELVDGLLFHGLALSAWKQAGSSRWSLRVNPSSGNLHPTEAYVLAPAIAGLGAGLYHYSPLLHALERRAEIGDDLWDALTRGLPRPCLLVGLGSIAWREAWKYGERAFRYCQHDVGHAVAALAVSAALHGWRAYELPAPGEATLAALLGLPAEDPGPEPETPETLLLLVPGDSVVAADSLAAWAPSAGALARFAALPLRGAANLLSEAHQPWPAIDEVTRATRRPPGLPEVTVEGTNAVDALERRGPAATDGSAPGRRAVPDAVDAGEDAAAPSPPAAALIRGRRSAVAMDGRTGITRAGFYDMLLRTGARSLPQRALAGPARVDLAIFVHRVDGLAPGLYLLLRDPQRAALWRAAADPAFAWTRAPGCPARLDLSLLRAGDGRSSAGAICCGQAIAADGCFALAMLADMRGLAAAPWLYRRLFWETGAIGQTLYLEAEALGISATGIGCFFDDNMHALLGLHGRELQSLYHFTVGGRVDDERLQTRDAYFHLEPSDR